MNIRFIAPVFDSIDPRRSALAHRRPFRGVAALVTTWLAAAGLVLVLPSTACGPSQSAVVREPTRCTFQSVDLTIVASKNINPTTTGEPRPVVVRVYQLKDDLRIRNAEFEEVWLRDKAALGEDLVQVGEVPIYPFSRTEVRFQRNEAAQFVVLVALFRSPRGRSWYTSFELPPPPGKGECGANIEASASAEGSAAAPAASCSTGNCSNLPPQPRYAVWIDGTRIDHGEDHLDEVEGTDRVQRVQLVAPPSDDKDGANGGKGGK